MFIVLLCFGFSLQLGEGWEPEVLAPKFAEIESQYVDVTPNPLFSSPNVQIAYNAFVNYGGCEVQNPGEGITSSKLRCTIAQQSKSTTDAGRRVTAGRAFLTKEVRDLPNFELRVNAKAKRVTLETTLSSRKATGVEYIDENGEVRTVTAKEEILLSAGAFGSPQLLLLSGIGSNYELERANIPTVFEIPGVGENYQDHAAVLMFFDVPTNGTAVDENSLETALSFSAYYRSSFIRDKDDPDIWVAPMFSRAIDDNTLRVELLVAVVSNIMSKGTVGLQTTSILDPPKINYGLVHAQEDMDRLFDAFMFVRDVMERAGATEVLPGGDGRFHGDFDFIRQTVGTLSAAVGTNAMGEVVDQRLHVKGVSNLRVVDSSVLPVIPNANTQSMAYMVGYHGADLILSGDPRPEL